ncbi:NAD-dependent protein deacylase [Echria macrotheca]|uniref:NAD-dependent protein deacylase n=1 Tax=Echria macrotheca TaxID=438768 RepID=A0AAJ0FG07_9PEZI|nr:NAD-dependent protein deacylase [Echria macrotheca]
MAPDLDYNSIEAFHQKLANSRRILAVCGAGLSAASGLPTFRGAGGLWRNYRATDLATPEAFDRDPGLVWLFYGYRRHMALNAAPNPGHDALAALARTNSNFMCLSQNVDNLHLRANHPRYQLRLLHGSLFDIKCTNTNCTHLERNNTADPFFPAIAAASQDQSPSEPGIIPLLDPSHPLPPITRDDIPRCPACREGLQRPGVVWFGEQLDAAMMADVNNWISREPVDIVLVIGTSSIVYPAAGIAERARTKGTTSVVTVNLEAETPDLLDEMSPGDFYFAGDATELLPRLLEPVIGRI